MPADLLKDDQLVRLASEHNVAQFVSFSPGSSPAVRHSRILATQEPAAGSSVEDAVRSMLNVAASCNIRTYTPSAPKGTPFHYQLTSVDEVASLVRAYAQQGYYTIVNETIDVNDGGVSGVALGGILEFAPQDTPRAVEKPGIMSVEQALGTRILEKVYPFSIEIPGSTGQRLEFSIHPERVGYRKTHILAWQVNPDDASALEVCLQWPNRFSRFIGDKAFGLLVADCLGVAVPRSTVVGRNVAPFSFGRPTLTGEHWIRTCPPRPVPGKFTTDSKWLDPFALLQQEDPDGKLISSVISQEGVDARFSGSSYPLPAGDNAVQGVSGRGDLFMLGRAAPEQLPEPIVADVRSVAARLAELLGPVRLEWVHDGEQAWVLQLHIARSRVIIEASAAGTAERWLRFDPNDGLDALRDLVRHAGAKTAGIVVTRPVGITSHVGEIIRESGIPVRFAPSAGDTHDS